MDIKKEDMIKKEDIIKKEYMIKKEDMDESKAGDGERPSYSELVDRVNEIAKPLAGKKLTKTIYRTTKKGILRGSLIGKKILGEGKFNVYYVYYLDFGQYFMYNTKNVSFINYIDISVESLFLCN